MISTNKNINIMTAEAIIEWEGNGVNTIFDKTRGFPNG